MASRLAVWKTPYTPQRLLDHLVDVPGSVPGPGETETAGVTGGLHGRLLLLVPAGLMGIPMPLPCGLDQLSVWFLSRPGVRRGLCRQAFAEPGSSVGPAEEEVAALHHLAPGWGPSLASFARSGGFAGCGEPLLPQHLRVMWGRNDRILRPPQLRTAQDLLGHRLELVDHCGHLPHLDCPDLVAERWLHEAAFA